MQNSIIISLAFLSLSVVAQVDSSVSREIAESISRHDISVSSQVVESISREVKQPFREQILAFLFANLNFEFQSAFQSYWSEISPAIASIYSVANHAV